MHALSREDVEDSKEIWRLIARKERWGLTWLGWLVSGCIFLLALSLLLFNIQPFLALSMPLKADTLVVEGWVHEYAIVAAAKEFKAGRYARVFATGGPVSGLGHYVNDYQTTASVGAARLRKAGVPEQFVQMVPSRVLERDRTYGSAVALRDWFNDHKLPVHQMNVLTEGEHARRTRLLFEEAFGKSVQVGIIAVPNPDYDQTHWWRYSEGVRDVLSEGIAYFYAKFLFYPSAGK